MSQTQTLDLKSYIRDIPDFPKPGILFRDITPLLASPEAFGQTVDLLADKYHDQEIDVVVAAEARGFIFAAPGKLPFDTHAFHYELEYGSDTLEIHTDGIHAGQRVLIIDDLLATGGTVAACMNLLEKTGAEVVGCGFVIELLGLGGAEKLAGHEVFSLVQYEES